MEDTLVFISSDNGPEMETWPDAAYSPFRSAKGSTWEGGQRVPGIFTWPGMIAADRATDGLFSQMDLFNTVLSLAGASGRFPRTATSTASTRPRSSSTPKGVQPQVPLLLADQCLLGAAGGGVEVHGRLHLGRRPGLLQPGWLHRGHPEVLARSPLQPLPRSQGEPELHDPQAGLHRQLHQRDRQALHRLSGSSHPSSRSRRWAGPD
jgi:hypothetical protein